MLGVIFALEQALHSFFFGFHDYQQVDRFLERLFLSLLGYLHNQIEHTFSKNPHRFFTERDTRSKLTLIATTLLSLALNIGWK